MRLTRRGWAAVGVVALAVLLGWQFGSRSLNAIAAPLLGALVVAVVQLARTSEPSVDLRSPEAGFPDQTRPLSLTVEGSGLAVVSVSMPDGISATRIETAVSLPRTFEQRVELQSRGIHTIGPVAVTQRDALGLVERTTEEPEGADVVVYPRRYDAPRERTLARLFDDEFEAERQEFDRLREYVPGDPLRNVHWKSSAKHDEFLVMEFSSADRTDTVTVAATSEPGVADEMASAALTVVELALDAHLDVEMRVSEETIPAAHGGTHRKQIRRLLARTEGGSLPDEAIESADVAVIARADGTTIRAGGVEREFERIVARERRRRGVTV